jgi:hypothetical protein
MKDIHTAFQLAVPGIAERQANFEGTIAHYSSCVSHCLDSHVDANKSRKDGMLPI